MLRQGHASTTPSSTPDRRASSINRAFTSLHKMKSILNLDQECRCASPTASCRSGTSPSCSLGCSWICIKIPRYTADISSHVHTYCTSAWNSIMNSYFLVTHYLGLVVLQCISLVTKATTYLSIHNVATIPLVPCCLRRATVVVLRPTVLVKLPWICCLIIWHLAL